MSAYAVDNSDTFPSAAQLAGLGIVDSGSNSYQYAYSSSTPTVYCLTTTVNGKSFYTSNSNLKPTLGGCPGHSAGGVGTITNLSVNPSFEATTAGVASFNASTARLTSGGDAGSAHLRTTRIATPGTWGLWWDAVPTGVQANETYAISIRARSNVSVSRDLRVEWRDAGGVAISAGSVNVATIGSSWTTMSGTIAAVPGAAGIRLTLYATGAGATTDYVDVDSVMITRTPAVQLYADGTTANWAWDGTIHNSSSKGIPL